MAISLETGRHEEPPPVEYKLPLLRVFLLVLKGFKVAKVFEGVSKLKSEISKFCGVKLLLLPL